MEKETTLPEKLKVNLLLDGWTEDQVSSLYDHLEYSFNLIGQDINIRDLAGVTVASDYSRGLASIDRGKEGLSPLDYTKNDTAEGCAKTVLVYREEKLKSYIVFRDIVVKAFCGASGNHIATALNTIAHECAHVELHSLIEHKMPEFLLKYAYKSYEENILMQFSESILMEYYACRRSAPFGKDIITDNLHTLVRDSLKDTLSKNKKAISTYRLHGDILQLLAEAGKSIYLPMQLIARLLGHLDGLESEYDIFKYLDDSPEKVFFEKHINEMQRCLRTLWDSLDSWENITLFEPLKRVGKQLLYDAGIQITSSSGGDLIKA